MTTLDDVYQNLVEADYTTYIPDDFHHYVLKPVEPPIVSIAASSAWTSSGKSHVFVYAPLSCLRFKSANLPDARPMILSGIPVWIAAALIQLPLTSNDLRTRKRFVCMKYVNNL